MTGKIAVGAAVLSLILIIVACSAPTPTSSTPAQTPTPKTAQAGTPSTTVVVTPPPTPQSNPKPSGPIKAKWIDAQVNGSAVSIPVNEVKNNWNTHFKIAKQGSNLTFMAYVFNGEIQVRANVCPPCRSIGYTLDNDLLVCDTCRTTFKAINGAGIQGACVNYPKAAIQFKIVDGNIVMNDADLVNAYQETLKPG